MSTFFAKHADRIIPEPNSGCWFWMGAIWNGYGPHRDAYSSDKGPIPAGLHVDHLCRVRCCVNPDHLEAVTQTENNARKRAHFHTRTHCTHGHLLADEGTYTVPSRPSEVLCRRCKREASRRYHQKFRSAV